MKRLSAIFGMAVVVLGVLALSSGMFSTAQARQTVPPLTEWQVIDLTQPMTLDLPLWPGDPAFEVEAWATYEEDYYFINRFSIGEHSATHWGTPNTFIEGARSADMFSAEELVLPAVVIDIRDKAAENEDYRLSVEDVQAWVEANGAIPEGAAVILYTGWQDRWNDAAAFINQDADGIMHWPGFSAEAVEYMIQEYGIGALGTDTHGADPGNDEEFGASFAMYDADGIILECLGGLDAMPTTGATIVIGGLPIEGGSGSPARIFAFVPPAE